MPAFNEAAAPFNQIGVAAHKGPIGAADTRLLDFGGSDHALAEFVRNNTVAQGDKLGVVLIPKNVLLLGFYIKVVNPAAGVTLTPSLRGKAHTYAAIDCSAVSEGFYAASGAAVPLVTEGVLSLALAVYDIKPDMLDMTLTALGAGGFGDLKIVISPVMLSVDTGGYR
jgi:hypothetical protein